jgi:hypothetical protein
MSHVVNYCTNKRGHNPRCYRIVNSELELKRERRSKSELHCYFFLVCLVVSFCKIDQFMFSDWPGPCEPMVRCLIQNTVDSEANVTAQGSNGLTGTTRPSAARDVTI